MAKQRMINTKFWSDGFVKEKLNPLDRYLFLYFLTNEKTNICGTYELPISTIASETGIEVEMLKKMLPRFKTKIYYIDGWVYIRNFKKHQSTSSSTVQKGIEIETAKIPSKIKDKIAEIEEKIQGMDRVSGGIIYLNSNLNYNSNLNIKNATKVADSVLKKKDSDLMSCSEFIESCRSSPQKHIQVIGEWAEAEQPKHTTRGEWTSFIKRNLRPARELSAYDISKIEKAFNLMLKDVKREEKGKKVGFITKYTLETVGKYIDKV